MSNFSMSNQLRAAQQQIKNLLARIPLKQFQKIEVADGNAAIDVTIFGTLIARDAKGPSDSTHALPAGKTITQIKKISQDGAGNSINADITSSNLIGGSKVRLTSDADHHLSYITLQWDGSNWTVIDSMQAAILA